MPFVNIQITREGATPEQKAQLIEGVTDLSQLTVALRQIRALVG